MPHLYLPFALRFVPPFCTGGSETPESWGLEPKVSPPKCSPAGPYSSVKSRRILSHFDSADENHRSKRVKKKSKKNSAFFFQEKCLRFNALFESRI